MILINPQPETDPKASMQKFGFTRTDFTGFLISTGFLSPGEVIIRWDLSRNFFAFDVKEES